MSEDNRTAIVQFKAVFDTQQLSAGTKAALAELDKLSKGSVIATSAQELKNIDIAKTAKTQAIKQNLDTENKSILEAYTTKSRLNAIAKAEQMKNIAELKAQELIAIAAEGTEKQKVRANEKAQALRDKSAIKEQTIKDIAEENIIRFKKMLENLAAEKGTIKDIKDSKIKADKDVTDQAILSRKIVLALEKVGLDGLKVAAKNRLKDETELLNQQTSIQMEKSKKAQAELKAQKLKDEKELNDAIEILKKRLVETQKKQQQDLKDNAKKIQKEVNQQQEDGIKQVLANQKRADKEATDNKKKLDKEAAEARKQADKQAAADEKNQGLGNMVSEINRGTQALSFFYSEMKKLTTDNDFVKASSTYEKHLYNFNSLAQETESQLKLTHEAIKGMVLDENLVGMAEAAKTLQHIESSGYHAAGAMTILEESSRAAYSGLADIFKVADAGTSILKAYSMEASEIGRINNINAKTVQYGKVTFDQLNSVIGTAISLAPEAKVKYEEVAAAISTITAQGVNAAIATTEVNALIKGIFKPSAGGKALADSLGLELSSANLAAKGLGGMVQEIMDKTAKFGPEQESVVAKLLGDIREIKGLFKLATNDGKLYTEMLGHMTDGTDQVSLALEQQKKTFVFAQKELSHTTEVLNTELGFLMQKSLKPFMQILNAILELFLKAPLGIRAFVETIALLGIGIVTTTIAIAGLIIAYKALTATTVGASVATAIYTGALSLLTKEIVLTGAATGGLKFLTDSLTLSLKSVQAALALTAIPFAPLIIALAAATAGFTLLDQATKTYSAAADAIESRNENLKDRAGWLTTINELETKRLKLQKEGKDLSGEELRELKKSYSLAAIDADNFHRKEFKAKAKALEEAVLNAKYEAKISQEEHLTLLKLKEDGIANLDKYERSIFEASHTNRENEQRKANEEFEQIQKELIQVINAETTTEGGKASEAQKEQKERAKIALQGIEQAHLDKLEKIRIKHDEKDRKIKEKATRDYIENLKLILNAEIDNHDKVIENINEEADARELSQADRLRWINIENQKKIKDIEVKDTELSKQEQGPDITKARQDLFNQIQALKKAIRIGERKADKEDLSELINKYAESYQIDKNKLAEKTELEKLTQDKILKYENQIIALRQKNLKQLTDGYLVNIDKVAIAAEKLKLEKTLPLLDKKIEIYKSTPGYESSVKVLTGQKKDTQKQISELDKKLSGPDTELQKLKLTEKQKHAITTEQGNLKTQAIINEQKRQDFLFEQEQTRQKNEIDNKINHDKLLVSLHQKTEEELYKSTMDGINKKYILQNEEYERDLAFKKKSGLTPAELKKDPKLIQDLQNLKNFSDQQIELADKEKKRLFELSQNAAKAEIDAKLNHSKNMLAAGQETADKDYQIQLEGIKKQIDLKQKEYNFEGSLRKTLSKEDQEKDGVLKQKAKELQDLNDNYAAVDLNREKGLLDNKLAIIDQETKANDDKLVKQLISEQDHFIVSQANLEKQAQAYEEFSKKITGDDIKRAEEQNKADNLRSQAKVNIFKREYDEKRALQNLELSEESIAADRVVEIKQKQAEEIRKIYKETSSQVLQADKEVQDAMLKRDEERIKALDAILNSAGINSKLSSIPQLVKDIGQQGKKAEVESVNADGTVNMTAAVAATGALAGDPTAIMGLINTGIKEVTESITHGKEAWKAFNKVQAEGADGGKNVMAVHEEMLRAIPLIGSSLGDLQRGITDLFGITQSKQQLQDIDNLKDAFNDLAESLLKTGQDTTQKKIALEELSYQTNLQKLKDTEKNEDLYAVKAATLATDHADKINKIIVEGEHKKRQLHNETIESDHDRSLANYESDKQLINDTIQDFQEKADKLKKINQDYTETLRQEYLKTNSAFKSYDNALSDSFIQNKEKEVTEVKSNLDASMTLLDKDLSDRVITIGEYNKKKLDLEMGSIGAINRIEKESLELKKTQIEQNLARELYAIDRKGKSEKDLEAEERALMLNAQTAKRALENTYEENKLKRKQDYLAKERKLLEENRDRIQKYNETAYNEELRLIESTLGKQRKELESNYDQQLKIIEDYQKKKDEILSNRKLDQEAQQEQTRLLNADKAKINPKLGAGFFRDNQQSFDTKDQFAVNEINSSFISGDISFEEKLTKLREQAAKRLIYLEFQKTINVNSSAAVRLGIEKQITATKEEYANLVDKDMIALDREKSQAIKKLDALEIELKTAREMEEAEIKKLDTAYKTSAGVFKTEMVNSTDYFVRYTNEAISKIGAELFNQVQKSFIKMDEAKKELLKDNSGVTSVPTGQTSSSGATPSPVTPPSQPAPTASPQTTPTESGYQKIGTGLKTSAESPTVSPYSGDRMFNGIGGNMEPETANMSDAYTMQILNEVYKRFGATVYEKKKKVSYTELLAFADSNNIKYFAQGGAIVGENGPEIILNRKQATGLNDMKVMFQNLIKPVHQMGNNSGNSSNTNIRQGDVYVNIQGVIDEKLIKVIRTEVKEGVKAGNKETKDRARVTI